MIILPTLYQNSIINRKYSINYSKAIIVAHLILSIFTTTDNLKDIKPSLIMIASIMMINPFLLLSLTSQITLHNRSNFAKQCSYKDFIFKKLSIINSATSYHYEMIIIPLKCWILKYQFLLLLNEESSMIVSDNNTYNFWINSTLLFLMILDVLLSLIISQFNVNYGKPIGLKSDHFSVTNPLFMTFYNLCCFISSLISISKEISDNELVDLSVNSLITLGFSGLLIFHLATYPFFNPEIEILFGRGLILRILFQIGLVIHQGVVHKSALFTAIVFPIFFIWFGKYMKSCYLSDYWNNPTIIKPKLANIKYVFRNKIDKMDRLEFSEKLGCISFHTQYCKKGNCSCKKLEIKLKNIQMEHNLNYQGEIHDKGDIQPTIVIHNGEEVCLIDYSKKKEEAEEPDNTKFAQNQYQALSNSENVISQNEIIGNERIFQAQKEIDKLTIKEYSLQGTRTSLKLYLLLVWYLKNSVELVKILNIIRELKSLVTSFNSNYIYFIAIKSLEETLTPYYTKSHLILDGDEEETNNENSERNINKFSENSDIRIDDELAFVNTSGVDLAYVFNYKSKIESLSLVAQDFCKNNLKYVENFDRNKSISELSKFSLKSFDLKNKFIKDYNIINKNSRKVEYLHVALNYYFTTQCLNLYSSGIVIFNDYQSRVLSSRRKLNISRSLENDTLMSKHLVLLSESNRMDFGQILDVFGNVVECLEARPRDIKTKNIDILLPNFMRKAHLNSCKIFMKEETKGYIGETIRRAVMVPGSQFFQIANIQFKLAPYSHYDFNFLTSLDFNQNDNNYYMLINQSRRVYGYSLNMRELFEEDFEDYLQVDIHISTLSKKLDNFLTELIGSAQEIESNAKLLSRISSKLSIRQSTIGKGLVDDSFPNSPKKNKASKGLRYQSSIIDEIGSGGSHRIKSILTFKSLSGELADLKIEFILDLSFHYFKMTECSYFIVKMVKLDSAITNLNKSKLSSKSNFLKINIQ